jgi:prepilin-type N-terminal cleavage/methylation domain-containing protein
MQHSNRQLGFTLMEIIVATALFAISVSAILGLFNYALQINRRVEALRQVAQGTRNFTEAFVREIRNGRIDYQSSLSRCATIDYADSQNTRLALVTASGDKVCYFLSGNNLLVQKRTASGGVVEEQINPVGFTITASKFHLYVRPTTNPKPSAPPYPDQQPFVTIVALFSVQVGADPAVTIPYQTTVGTDAYDLP